MDWPLLKSEKGKQWIGLTKLRLTSIYAVII